MDPARRRRVAVLVEDEQSVMTVGSVCAQLPRLRHVWQLDAGALDQLVARGEAIPAATVDSLRRIVLPDATAVVAYTSGASGHAMGCALSHRGLAFICDTLLAGWGHVAAPPGEQGSVLAFLPFSHVYGLMIQSLCIRGGLLMGHEPDLSADALSTSLRSFRPTYLYAVPSLLEKIYKNFLRASQLSGRGALFERAAGTARDFAAATERQRLGRGSGPGFDLRMQHALYERTVYRRLRATLGGRVLRATSGGSPSRDLSLFYEGIGIYVHDGYGLTETSGGITMQPYGREKSGTVGQPLPGTAIKVAEDGEILVRGPSVFQGYVGDPAATRAALRGGWLATGDLGYWTARATSRSPAARRTSSSPAAARAWPRPPWSSGCGCTLVHQAVVVGDNRPCVGALITLDPDFLADWRAALSLQGDAPARRRGRRTRCVRRSGGRSPRPTAACPVRVDPGVPGAAGAVRRVQRTADAVDEAAPGRDRAPLRAGDRRDVPVPHPPGAPRPTPTRRCGTRTTCSADHARHGVRVCHPAPSGRRARRLRPHGNPTIGERNSSDDRPGDDRGLEGDMAPESRRDRTLAGEEITSRIASFPGSCTM